ncbi:MAG: hypothetical protein ACYDA0_07045 [Candidatus Dormibacteraceae bacterium]
MGPPGGVRRREPKVALMLLRGQDLRLRAPTVRSSVTFLVFDHVTGSTS